MRRDFKALFIEGKRPYVWIAALVVLLYVRALWNGFTYFDDNVLILDNLFFLRDLGNLANAFRMEVFHVLHASAAYYRPVLTISLMIDAQLGGDKAAVYYATNLIIHILTSLVIYRLFIEMKYKKEVSLVAAAVFAIHPALTQAVAWIPGRNDSLLALFVLGGFYYFVKFTESFENRYFAMCVALFALSVFTKESGVLFPVICGLYILVVKRVNLFEEKLLYLFLAWVGVGCVWIYLRSIALASSTGSVNYTPLVVGQILAANSPAVLLYLGKAFFPVNLTVLPTLQDSSLVYGVAASLLLVLMVVFSRGRRWGIMLFGTVWFLGFLLPSFIRPSSEYVADFIEHRMYLPSFGLILVVLETGVAEKLVGKVKAGILVLIGVLAALFVMSFVRVGLFGSGKDFWEAAVKGSPNHPLAHKNLGAMYYFEDEDDKAELEYRRALELNPGELMVHNNLGLIYFENDEFEKAENEYKEELKVNPYYDKVHLNYGNLLYKTGDKERALEMWTKAVVINPDYGSALLKLAYYYQEEGDVQKAGYFLNEARKRGARI